MKAVVRNAYGGIDEIKIVNIEKPKIKSGHLLIKVYATTVNRTDQGVLTGLPHVFRFFIGLFKPRYDILGTDCAGEVVEIGEGVKKYKIGDKVWAFNDQAIPSQAEYCILSENEAIELIPGTYSYEQAVCGGEGFHYAYNFINKINIEAGQDILVIGASGGIGTSMVQILTYLGINVTTVAHSNNHQLMLNIGAIKNICYDKEDFTRMQHKYHHIFDAAGKSDFGKCKPLLMNGGRYLSSELGPGNENLYLPLITLFADKKVIFPLPTNIKKSMKFALKMMGENKFIAVIDKEYQVEDARLAYEYMMTGMKTGNVILKLDQNH